MASSTIKQDMQSGVFDLEYDGAGFPLQSNIHPYKSSATTCIIARNNTDGSIYALWYRYASQDYRIASVIHGTAPSIGDHIHIGIIY